MVPQTLRCVASLRGQKFTDTTELLYLPYNPYHGSTVKLDRRSGALWARNDVSRSPGWEKLIPFGWYDVSSSRCLATDRVLKGYVVD